jgi:ABC-type multidrug transport system ATPase subunit
MKKLYAMQDAAETLGVDIETLRDWMADAQLQPMIDSSNQPALDEEQVRQLARQHNIQRSPAVSPQPPFDGKQGQQPGSQPATQGLPAPSGNGTGAALQVGVPDVHPIQLGDPSVTIGRAPDNTVVLNHPQVSGHHARLELLQGGAYRIVDLHSTNHVYVNGQRVKTRVLKENDQIGIGPFLFIYTGRGLVQQYEGEGIRIDALHLKQYGKWHSLLLRDISLPIPARKFVALVGGSGVGKTTLLNALSGLHPARKGTVLYNGQDYYRHLDDFSTQIGYVPQDDIMHGGLTVAEALYYTARLRLPNDFTRGQIKERVSEVLEDVGLTSRRHHLVRSLSGGERKRVSIALELLANPSVFFLDEPSAGLDPGLDLKMMLLLRTLADKGHTIVLVTHATENIDICDYVCFLAQGGRLAFYGSPQEAKEYFRVAKFSEIYNLLEPAPDMKNIPERAEERFKQSPYYQHYVVDTLNHHLDIPEDAELPERLRIAKRGNPWRQFSLLSRRYLRLIINDVGNLLILLLQAPVIGIILYLLASHSTFSPTSIVTCPLRQDPVNNAGRIVSIDCQRVVDLLNTPQGAAFAQQQGQTRQQLLQAAITPNSGADAQTLIFIMAFTAVLFGCVNGAREIVKEAPIYRRERMVNLGIAPYVFSKVVVLGIFSLLQSLVIVYFVNLKAPFHQGIFLPVLVEISITMMLAAMAGLMIGLLISALAPNTDRALSLVPIALIPQVIFSGAVFKLDTPVLQAIGDLFAVRWAMAGMGSSVGLHPDKLGVDSFAYQGTLFTTLNPADARPGAIMHLLIVWGALALMVILLGLLIAFFLKRKDVRA